MDLEVLIDSEKLRKFSDKFNKCEEKNEIKYECEKIIMLATPNILEFRDFEYKKFYKKIVLLKNVSLNIARFQLGVKKKSKFLVFLEFRKSQKGSIAPGMSAKLIVTFRPNFCEEHEENIIIRVQGGKDIVLLVRAFKHPPILQGVCTLYHSYFNSDSFLTSSMSESLKTITLEKGILSDFGELSFSEDEENKTYSVYLSEISEFECVSSNKNVISHFECGNCFIGELVISPTKIKNIGTNGRFFIMSEIDWSSMKIEDVTKSNMVLTPPFAILPAYFALQHNEEITLQSLFFPSTYGMQVDKYFIISDNCSVHPIEIIGDGILFEEKFVIFNEKKLDFMSEICEDNIAKYCVKLNFKKSETGAQTVIEVSNTSNTVLYYRWEQREVLPKYKNCEENWRHLPLNYIFINPKNGILKPYSSTIFLIFIQTEDLVSDEYRTILQLCIEDIPLAAINKNLNLRSQYSEVKRRTCKVTVDIFIFDVEIRISNLSPDSSDIIEDFYEDKNIQTDKDFILESNFYEKLNEEKCKKCYETIPIETITELQNEKSVQTMKCKVLQTEIRNAVLKPEKFEL